MPSLPHLHAVTEADTCMFCMRRLPVEALDLLPGTTVDARVCRDAGGCVAEVNRQEREGWADHPAFRRAV